MSPHTSVPLRQPPSAGISGPWVASCRLTRPHPSGPPGAPVVASRAGAGPEGGRCALGAAPTDHRVWSQTRPCPEPRPRPATCCLSRSRSRFPSSGGRGAGSRPTPASRVRGLAPGREAAPHVGSPLSPELSHPSRASLLKLYCPIKNNKTKPSGHLGVYLLGSEEGEGSHTSGPAPQPQTRGLLCPHLPGRQPHARPAAGRLSSTTMWRILFTSRGRTPRRRC